MSTLLKQVGEMAGITRVVWIDDLFATNADLLIEKIVIKIPAILKAGQTLDHRKFREQTWNADATPGTFTQQVNVIVAGNNVLALEVLESLVAQQLRDDPETPLIPADLSAAQIELIKGAFTNVVFYSFDTWQKNKGAVMAAADDSVLFIVDRDFDYEIPGGKDKGLAIMKELLKQPKMPGVFILMSHSFSKESEISERDTFSAANDCHAAFAFISKGRLILHSGNAAEQNNELASALHDALVRAWCHRASATASEVVAQAVKDAHRQMLNQTFNDLGGGIFYLSQRDGVLETETMARIFMLAGRIALQDEMVKKSTLHQQLDTLRKITKQTKYVPPRGKDLSGQLKEWRNREVWDPPSIVNGAFSQPSCGDVYVCTTAEKQRTFLLLGQPCNLAIRANGKRNDNEALFAECLLEEPPPESRSSYEIAWDGVIWFVRFDWVYPINLSVLDAVASSISGDVKFEFKKPLPVGLLLGMAKRLTDAAKVLNDAADPEIPYEFRTFSVSETLKCEPSLDKPNGIYKAPLKRIGRIRSPYADVVFGALANYHTRMAFDFDFSKIP